MSFEHVTTKTELLVTTTVAWDELTALLARLSPEQKTGLRDEAGWTVQDHLVHLAAWERSVLFMLQGRPRHEGLGIERALYESDNIDRINAAIVEQHRGQSLQEAEAELHRVHEALLDLIRPLEAAALERGYSDFLPDEPDDARTALEIIYANTAYHFNEHRDWIEGMVGKA